MTDQNKHIDWVLVLLFAGMMFFTGVILFTEWKYPNDGQLYQTFAGLLTGFSGAFFGRIIPRNSTPSSPVTVVPLTSTLPASAGIDPETKP